MESVFGGLDKYENEYKFEDEEGNGYDRRLRPSGIASEIYSQIIANLSSQCEQIHGFFVEAQFAEYYGYGSVSGTDKNYCKIVGFGTSGESFKVDGVASNVTLSAWYNFINEEDMCPAGYAAKIDTKSWGICSCWENGNYRSKNGKSETCLPVLRMKNNTIAADDTLCTKDIIGTRNSNQGSAAPSETNWCQQNVRSSKGQVCPGMNTLPETDAETGLSTGVIHCADADHVSIPAVENQKLHNH